MRTKLGLAICGAMIVTAIGRPGYAETKQEYENRFLLMLDYAVRVNDYIRSHLGDKKLSAYAQVMSEKNVDEAEKMTPPDSYAMLHPHFLMVLENIERSCFFAAKGDITRYRKHQKLVLKELHLLEALSEKANFDPYLFQRRY